MGDEAKEKSLGIETNIGSIEFFWKSNGRLKRIVFSGLDSQNGDESSRLEIQGQTSNGVEVVSSCDWLSVLERFKTYLVKGEPLGAIPWEKIEDEDWTDFQREVYRIVAQIPHGETRTYAWVARRIRRSGACRAVGQALRNNPVPVLIPCHRVVSKKGGIGGFMGAADRKKPEVYLKETLIRIEDRYLNPEFPFLDGFCFNSPALAVSA